MSEPTEEFLDSFVDSGSPVVDCELCGRTHFDANGEFMDEGELEKLEAKQKEHPDKYVSHDGGPHWGTIAGKQFVSGCRCGQLVNYENFIWNHRFSIASYFNRRSGRELKEAQMQSKKIADLKV